MDGERSISFPEMLGNADENRDPFIDLILAKSTRHTASDVSSVLMSERFKDKQK